MSTASARSGATRRRLPDLFYTPLDKTSGARRLEQLRYLADDPFIGRFSGLGRVPIVQTVVNWLKQFTHQAMLAPLVELQPELVLDSMTRYSCPAHGGSRNRSKISCTKRRRRFIRML
jgi:hypothetical protein